MAVIPAKAGIQGSHSCHHLVNPAEPKGAPLLPQVVEWMAGQGWLPTEISGFSRPRDRLVQVDMLFAPRDSALRPTRFHF